MHQNDITEAEIEILLTEEQMRGALLLALPLQSTEYFFYKIDRILVQTIRKGDVETLFDLFPVLEKDGGLERLPLLKGRKHLMHHENKESEKCMEQAICAGFPKGEVLYCTAIEL